MASHNSYPPQRLHSTQAISSKHALALLSSYLEASVSDASLHPNAMLTEGGPMSTTSGSNTGLILHNLKRVEAGLRGEHLGADLSFSQSVGEGLPDPQISVGDEASVAATMPIVEVDGQNPNVKTRDGDWQDRTEFEREQEVTQGEIGESSQLVSTETKEGGDVPIVRETPTAGDKEDRKKKKKERRAQEKRDEQMRKRLEDS